MELFAVIDEFNSTIETVSRETERSIRRAEWRARQKIKKSNCISCTVKARLVGGCLVITLPSEIKRAAQIEAGDSVSLAMDESGKIRVERVREDIEVSK